MDEIVLMGDPRVAAIEVVESGEPLVPVDDLPVSIHKEDLGPDRLLLRASVAERLRAAAGHLRDGIRLLFVEGWRAPQVQRGYFEDYRERLRRDGIATDEDELHQLASRYVSPPPIAPHTSGAAIDLTLCTDDGVELDLGTWVNATPEESRGGIYTAATNISAEGRANRAILSAAMDQAGLVNYPTEWWHWSYGDRYWALTTGTPKALYGLTA
jgi:D-alanyl-D-alanine dipeptidase